MYYAVLFAHILLAVMIVIVVLLQRSEGAALTPSDAQAFGSRRAPPHPLSRLTAILAFLFVVTSLSLTWIGQANHRATSILDRVQIDSPKAPANPETAPAEGEGQAKPSAPPAGPQVPVTK